MVFHVIKVSSLSIAKTVHLLSGVAALLLSFVPSLRGEALPWLQQPAALYLAFIGLANLLVAPLQAQRRSRRQLAGSVLLVLAVLLQSVSLLLPLEQVAGLPVVLASLVALALASLLQLLPPFGLPAAGQSAGQPADSARPARPAAPKTAPARTVTSTRPAPATAELRETGTVKWFNTAKGFGFISRDSGDDIFVHFRAIRGEGHRALVEGQRVEFAVVRRDKGLQAEDVDILD